MKRKQPSATNLLSGGRSVSGEHLVVEGVLGIGHGGRNGLLLMASRGNDRRHAFHLLF
jgi:hypothetical protein